MQNVIRLLFDTCSTFWGSRVIYPGHQMSNMAVAHLNRVAVGFHRYVIMSVCSISRRGREDSQHVRIRMTERPDVTANRNGTAAWQTIEPGRRAANSECTITGAVMRDLEKLPVRRNLAGDLRPDDIGLPRRPHRKIRSRGKSRERNHS
jgi:hypothetical protein